MKFKNLLKFSAVLSTLFIYSCSENSKTQVEIGNEQGILLRGNSTEPSDIDPHTTTGMPEYYIQMAVFEALVAKDPKTLEIIPAVAESWNISDDGLTYTFNIRKNAKWSNGDDLTASDFVYSWKRALMPALGNQYAYSVYVIKNAKKFNLGEISDFNQVGVKATTPKTLVVELENHTPYFLKLLDHHSMYPVHQATIEKHGKIDDRGTVWTRPDNFVGNGPYSLNEWIPNKILTVKKNEYYWDKDKLAINEIHFHPIENSATEERMFRSGQLHFTDEVPIDKVAKYQKKSPKNIMVNPYFGTYFYRLNTTLPHLSDVRVRKALSYSIDRELITKHVTKSGEIPTYNLTPPNTQGYTAEAKHIFDPEKAKSLLAEAGYPNGDDFPTLEIMYNTHESHKKIALAIQQMWKKALNIDVTLHNQEWKVFLDSERTMSYEVTRSSWIGDYLDPNTFLDMFLTDGGNNKTGWSNKRYDELIALAAKSNSQEERYQYFQEAESILIEEAPIIPIYTYTARHLVSDSLKGLEPNILDYQPYKYQRLEATTK